MEPPRYTPVYRIRITEYPELEGTRKDHRVQLLAPQRTTQKSNPMPERTVQTLLELQQAWCHDHYPGEPVPVLSHPLVIKLFLIPNLNLPWVLLLSLESRTQCCTFVKINYRLGIQMRRLERYRLILSYLWFSPEQNSGA